MDQDIAQILQLDPAADGHVDQLVELVRALCRDRTRAVPSEPAGNLIRRWGVEALRTTLDRGIGAGGNRRLLTAAVFSCLYTVGMRCAAREEEAAADLFRFHSDQVSNYLQTSVLPALNAQHGEQLLVEFRTRWDNHKIFTEWMRKMFMYLDRADNFARGERKLTTTSQSLQLFKTLVFDRKKNDIVQTIQDFVNRDREGQAVDRSMLKSVVQLFLVMGVAKQRDDFKNQKQVVQVSQEEETGTNDTYVTDFERPFIANSVEWYTSRSNEWMANDSVPVYLQKVEDALASERHRVNTYLNRATEPKLIEQLVQVMLKDRQQALLESDSSGLNSLLADERFEDVGRMFRMFRLWDKGLEPMAHMLRDFIRDRGLEVVRQRGAKLRDKKLAQTKIKEFDPAFIDALLRIHRQFDGVLNTQLDNDTLFQKEISDAFRTIVNTPPGGKGDMHPTATLLGSYLDMIFKGSRGRERLTQERMDQLADDCKTLFDYVNDKDMFQESYRVLLMRRLLSGSSASMDSERTFIQKLKMSEGSQFTQRFEGMLGDLVHRDESMADFPVRFRSFLEEENRTLTAAGEAAPPMWEFGVRILCAAYWPNPVDTKEVKMPQQMKSAVDFYKSVYSENNQDERRLNFALAEGTATLRMNFESGWKEFEMMTLQAMIVLCFNQRGQWTPAQLGEHLGLEARRVMQLIHPITCAKPVWRLLLNKSNPKTPRIAPTDIIEFNTGYRGPKKRVKVPAVTLRELVQKKPIDVGRQHMVDAAIVRIMKTRHTLRQNQLLSEVTDQVKRMFSPQPRMVKMRIEALIQQEYLERDEEERTNLHYKA